MWSRIQYSEITEYIAAAAFTVAFGIFLITSVRAWKMKKETREKMENLPFEDEEEPSSQK
jgi:cbb3-type cytochrome oxidase subunit 3